MLRPAAVILRKLDRLWARRAERDLLVQKLIQDRYIEVGERLDGSIPAGRSVYPLGAILGEDHSDSGTHDRLSGAEVEANTRVKLVHERGDIVPALPVRLVAEVNPGDSDTEVVVEVDDPSKNAYRFAMLARRIALEDVLSTDLGNADFGLRTPCTLAIVIASSCRRFLLGLPLLFPGSFQLRGLSGVFGEKTKRGIGARPFDRGVRECAIHVGERRLQVVLGDLSLRSPDPQP